MISLDVQRCNVRPDEVFFGGNSYDYIHLIAVDLTDDVEDIEKHSGETRRLFWPFLGTPFPYQGYHLLLTAIPGRYFAESMKTIDERFSQSSRDWSHLATESFCRLATGYLAEREFVYLRNIVQIVSEETGIALNYAENLSYWFWVLPIRYFVNKDINPEEHYYSKRFII